MLRYTFLAALLGCGSQTAQESGAFENHEEEREEEVLRAESTPSHDDVEVTDAQDLCLPLVDGCGCSSMCARGERHIGGNQYEVSHDGQDSRFDQASRGGLCFDERGVSSPDDGSGCMDTFQWGSCGGECIPTPVPICGIVDGSCQRVDSVEHSAARWANATYRVSLSANTRAGTLRLFGNRYVYEGEASPPALGEAFYFIEHHTGVLRVETQDETSSTVGVLRFDPQRADFEAMNPRRTLGVRREENGTYRMHSIVSEFQQWSIRSE